jgi:hypothetical protein
MKLHLHGQSKYFRAVKSGLKKIEYRLNNPFWHKRLFNRTYDGIVYYNGYKPGLKNCIEMPWDGAEITTIIHEHFGARLVSVFAIRVSACRDGSGQGADAKGANL